MSFSFAISGKPNPSRSIQNFHPEIGILNTSGAYANEAVLLLPDKSSFKPNGRDAL
jgi:hypothetical protein